MNRLLSVLLAFAACFFAACSDPLDDARSRLRGVDVTKLRLDAAKLAKQFQSVPGPDFLVLKPSLWPDTFKKLRPLRVGMYRDGLAVALSGESRTETGLHIVPEGMTDIPDSPNVKYDKLAEGVYFYAIGK